MKKKNLLISASLALGVGVGVFAGIGLHNGVTEVNEVKAENVSRTVYCAIYGSWLGSYSLKVNANVGDGDTWLQSTMVNTGKTYENMMIFRGAFEERYGGVDALQFQIYDGETYKWQRQPISKFTTYGTYSDRMYLIGDESVHNWVDYQETTVSFVDKNDVVGEELEYNAANNQYEGVYTTASDSENFRIKKVTGKTATFASTLDGKLPSSVAESDGSWITVKKASAYMVYFKSDSTIWIQDAEADLVAYAYAGYFLTHIGCDPNGVNAPSGWSSLETRYSGLADDVKDYIYGFNVATAEAGDDIAEMIERYNWAINHNPNTLSHFIVNRSDVARIVPAGSGIVSTINNNGSSNTAIVVTVTAASIALLGTAGFFLLRRRKEN